MAKKFDHRSIDLRGALLLGPVTASWQDNCLAQLRHQSGHFTNRLTHAGKIQNNIALPSYIERWYAYFCAAKWSEEFPIAIDVSVPVEPAAKSGAVELARVKINIGLGQPCRQ